MKRIYYVGGEDGYTDTRLPGLVLGYGTAVDTDDDRAKKLLALPQFSDRIIPPQHVKHEAEVVAKAKITSIEGGQLEDDTEENHDDT